MKKKKRKKKLMVVVFFCSFSFSLSYTFFFFFQRGDPNNVVAKIVKKLTKKRRASLPDHNFSGGGGSGGGDGDGDGGGGGGGGKWGRRRRRETRSGSLTKDELSSLGLSWESNVRVVGEENGEESGGIGAHIVPERSSF